MGRAQKAHLVVDGRKIADLRNEEEVVVKRNRRDHLMVTDKDQDYFRLLREKLKFGDRAWMEGSENVDWTESLKFRNYWKYAFAI